MGPDLTHGEADVSLSNSPVAPRAVLIVEITCASISLIAAFLTFQWFALMRRNFRHHLIMGLIISDMFKAVWFFIFPLVVFARGPVSSSSSFCHASGFFLAQATEASDFAALMLALHLVLCIFRPPKRGSEGGLHDFRNWIYGVWVVLPILMASLAFVNTGNAYVSYGSFCYLPERPVWERMALAWIPRYIVFVAIFSAALAITLHVHIKFKHFGHLDEEGSPENSGSMTAPENGSLSNTQLPRVASMTLSIASDMTEGVGGQPPQVSRTSTATDTSSSNLLTHRHDIERHLRILFLYPVSYLVVWALPFVSQCLQLTGRRFEQQPHWLRLLVTALLALQASVDAAVFCYRERPWGRARGENLIGRIKSLVSRPSDGEGAEKGEESRSGSVHFQETVELETEARRESVRTSTCWWEEEGRKRRDSVWMGTDITPGLLLSQIPQERSV